MATVSASGHNNGDHFGTAAAPKQDGECGDCRACWDTNVKNVSYKEH